MTQADKIIRENPKRFIENLPVDFEIPTDTVGERIFREYGAVFVAQNKVVVPDFVIFKDEGEVSQFHSKLDKTIAKIGDFTIELQTPAMKKLLKAQSEAKKNGLTITPRGTDSGKRIYFETVELWASRVNPGLIHWVENGKLSEQEAAHIRALAPFDQVREIFRLEARGLFFSKDLSKSIVYSVAPPGTSQHLSMLAFDVAEYNDAFVSQILADHFWFQTVVSDLPHFTYLGTAEKNLSDLGLKKIFDGNRHFWIPDC